METNPEYIKDISEIRSMMERSSKFLSLTGWSGIMAGLYALAGAYLMNRLFFYSDLPQGYERLNQQQPLSDFYGMILIALAVLMLTLATATILAYRKSTKNGEKLWSPAARRTIVNMGIPLLTGALLIAIFLTKGLTEYIAPLTLIFYGLALINACKFTYEEFRYLGIIEILLGLFACYYTEHGLMIWAIGFGVMHIIYGIYMHLSFEK